MKNLFNLVITACATATLALAGACSTNDADAGNFFLFEASGDVDGVDVLESYAKDVVITRYENLADKAQALYHATQEITFGASDESTKIAAAAAAWVEARLAWERTEAYLFGPVDLYKIDPGIDSWPLALADLAVFMTGYAAGTYSDYHIANDNGERKGFHAVEFLLFEDGNSKKALTDFNSAEISSSYGLSSVAGADVQKYLVAIAKELYYNTVLLVAEWEDIDAVASYEAADALSVKTNNGGGYYDDFTTAGDDESSYSSISDALSVILENAAGIAEEVGDVKISDPYTSKDVLDVESWFSWNSVYDFTDNIIGIKEAYYGKLYSGLSDDYTATAFGSAAANSISAYVASGSSNLDTLVKEAIEEAIEKVAALPYPFRSYLSDSSKSADIEAAMDACLELVDALAMAQSAVNDGYYITE
ncbi:MAG: imelysin family protein [Rikenellaceae bacterium]